MKKLKFIFVFIFLTGMLYTVFQYIPILEEESHAQRLELAKKTKQNNTDGDGGNDLQDDDCDDDSQSDLKLHTSTYLTSFYSNFNIHSTNRHTLYKHQLDNIHTPPPEA